MSDLMTDLTKLSAETMNEQEQENGEHFAQWFRREVPPGTVIGNPDWWSARILRFIDQWQARGAQTAEPTPEPVESHESCAHYQERCRLQGEINRLTEELDGFKSAIAPAEHIGIVAIDGMGQIQVGWRWTPSHNDKLYTTPPAEPTPEMIKAGADVVEHSHYVDISWAETAAATYKAMIAATEKP